MNGNISRPLGTAIVVVVALFASACSVPLAPGYRVVKESREVKFVPGSPAEVQIQVQYALQNSGTSDLSFIDMIFPDEHAFGRANLRVELDGRETTPANLPAEYQEAEPDALRIPLDPAWIRGQSRQLSIAYALRSPENSGARITIGENSFHLGMRGWLPEPQPPKRVLAPYPDPPNKIDFAVRVPADFVILARGIPKGKKKDGNEVEYRFQLDSATKDAYVVAGKYVVWPSEGKSNSTIFWTAQPSKDDPAAGAGQISGAWNILEKDFGPLDKNINGPHIVESPELRGYVSGDASPTAVAFLGGAIVNPSALALGTSNEQFLQIVNRALAHEWFGDAMYIARVAGVGMGEGLPEYAIIVVDEARNGVEARKRRVTDYLRRYDEATKEATEAPLGAVTMGDAAGPRRIALAKAPLFFVALEDACGESPMHAGLARLVSVMRGREANYSDLRSALEQSSNRNLAGMFRLWLNEKGIPEDFRQRYQGAAIGELAEK